MSDLTTLLAQLNTQVARMSGLTTTPTTDQEVTMHDTAEIDMHDWAAYDSSDIHERTAEWEAQAVAAERPVIQHYTPKRVPLGETRRRHANQLLDHAMPGVRLGEGVSERLAHQMLTDFCSLDDANMILAIGQDA